MYNSVTVIQFECCHKSQIMSKKQKEKKKVWVSKSAFFGFTVDKKYKRNS